MVGVIFSLVMCLLSASQLKRTSHWHEGKVGFSWLSVNATVINKRWVANTRHAS